MKNVFLIGLFFAVFAEFGCRKRLPPSQGPLPVNVVSVVEKEVNEWDEFTGRLDPVEIGRDSAARVGILLLRFILKRARLLKKATSFM